MGKKESETEDVTDALIKMRVRQVLECDTDNMEKEKFYMKLDQAKLGMVYMRDREVMKRISTGHMIRVINFIATNEDEKKKYIETTMPEIAIVKQIEGK